MKKIFIVLFLAGVAFVLVAVGAIFYLGPLVKSGVEKVGPKLTQTTVDLKSASISILNGTGKLNGFVIGNPDGFKTPSAFKVNTINVSLVPKSVLGDKVIVRSVQIDSPEITYEAGFGGSNIGKLLENIQAVASSEKSQGTNAPGKPMQVDEFVITGGKINVSASILGGTSASLPLPEIRLANLGQGPEGITPAELSSKVFSAVVEAAAKAVAGNAANFGKNAAEAAANLGADAQDRLKKVSSGVTDLFKSKKE